MKKKNEYVSTIGFNRNDPVHRRAVEILNAMSRGKADYIAKAVVYYADRAEAGTILSSGEKIDYEKIREYVLRVIAEHEVGLKGARNTELKDFENFQEQSGDNDNQKETMEKFKTEELEGIMDTLASFRQ